MRSERAARSSAGVKVETFTGSFFFVFISKIPSLVYKIQVLKDASMITQTGDFFDARGDN
jgi:hypothetical protein